MSAQPKELGILFSLPVLADSSPNSLTSFRHISLPATLVRVGNWLSVAMDLSVRYIVFHQIQDYIEFKLWEKLSLSIFLAIIIVLAFVVHGRIIAFLDRHKGKR